MGIVEASINLSVPINNNTNLTNNNTNNNNIIQRNKNNKANIQNNNSINNATTYNNQVNNTCSTNTNYQKNSIQQTYSFGRGNTEMNEMVGENSINSVQNYKVSYFHGRNNIGRPQRATEDYERFDKQEEE